MKMPMPCATDTHSDPTASFYFEIFKSLKGSVTATDSVEFGVHIAGQIADRRVSQSTVKIYRSAVRGLFLRNGWEHALTGLEQGLSRQSKAHFGPSSRTTVKHVDPVLRSIIFDELAVSQRRYSAHLLYLLSAISATGLRPVEWAGALISEHADQCALTVKNAKYKPAGSINPRSAITNARRGNGPTRTLIIKCSPEEQQELLQTIRKLLVCEAQFPWKKCKRSLGKELKRVLNALIKRGTIDRYCRDITIYSFRHQAASDAKASLGTEEGKAAAALGHASARTAVRSYGHPGRGGTGLRVEPADECVDLVDNLDTGNGHIVGPQNDSPATPSFIETEKIPFSTPTGPTKK